MKFCPKCGTLMKVEKKTKLTYFVCPSCGKRKVLKKGKVTISGSLPEKKKDIVVLKKGDEAIDLPKTKAMCPECDHREAYWWMQQTRSADEPPTIFYKCTKCGHSWRSYG